MLVRPLLPYQDPAVDKFLARGKLLLAMDMGTGKTVVSIAAAEELLGCEDINYCLIVCPASLKYQWAEAIAKFTDIPKRTVKVKKTSIVIPQEPYCIVVDGTPGSWDEGTGEYTPGTRDKQYAMIGPKTDYIIMGYDNVLDDHVHVRRIEAQMTVLDEITQIKTPAAKRTKRIKRMLDSPYKLGLTGTPVDNILEDLFSIMEWVDPDVLGDWFIFENAFIQRDGSGQVTKYVNMDTLREILEPAIFRKRSTDPDVAQYMPRVHTGDWYVDLDDHTWDVYCDMANDLLVALEQSRIINPFDIAARYTGKKVNESSALGKIMARQQAIKLLLDHPDLVRNSAREYAESERQRKEGVVKKLWPGSKYAHEVVQSGLVDDLMHSPKIQRLVRECHKILNENEENKILIYTHWVPLLDIIMNAIGLPAVQYKGTMTPVNKAAAIRKFAEDPECRIFISSHAGAYGCDMYMANWLINLDLPPAVGTAAQINGRHVRAASEFTQVYVRNILASGTIEERDPERLNFKGRIGSAILDGIGADIDGSITDDRQSLTDWLRETLEG